MFTKFHGNRLKIDGVVNEKHALLVSSVLMYSVGWMELALDWFVLPEKINVFQHGGDREQSRPQGLKYVHNFLMTVLKKMRWACNLVAKMLLIL